MSLKEEYAKTSAEEKDKTGKDVISDDAFAICDFIERLINKLERIRRSVITK